jgi:hypothetical protein
MIYFPSVDSGGVSSYLNKKPDNKFDELFGVPARWFEDPYPIEYQHKYYLASAGVRYKKMDYIEAKQFPKDLTVFGDSGGYQITSGILEWHVDLRKLIFEWLEANSTLAANLDLPPRGKMENKYRECLDISKENFRYFYENQTGRTQFLNCLQGFDYDSYQNWYDEVKEFKFEGWAIGDPKGPVRYMAIISILLPEIMSGQCKILHFFGVSSIQEMIVLSYFEKRIQELGIDFTLTIDSSSPGLGSSYGLFYTGFSYANNSFKSLRIPREREIKYLNSSTAPLYHNYTTADDILFANRSLRDVANTFSGPDYASIALHNLFIFFDAVKDINKMIHCDTHMIEQIVTTETFNILKSVDDYINCTDPKNIYSKYLPFYRSIKDSSMSEVRNHNFF